MIFLKNSNKSNICACRDALQLESLQIQEPIMHISNSPPREQQPNQLLAAVVMVAKYTSTAADAQCCACFIVGAAVVVDRVNVLKVPSEDIRQN